MARSRFARPALDRRSCFPHHRDRAGSRLAGGSQRFATGDKVRVTMAVQPVDMVPASRSGASTPTDPSASMSIQPGDSAVVTGRIMGVDRGLLVVESPSGPIQIWVGESPRYSVSQTVQVRTNVAKAQ